MAITKEDWLRIKNENENEKAKETPIISSKELSNLEDRTLLFGYTCDKETHHVYLKDQEIHVVRYPHNEPRYPHIEPPYLLLVKTNQDFIPNKRVYPAASDLEFIQLLQSKSDLYISFTTWSQRQYDIALSETYYGKILLQHLYN
jgi:hypothetical protein